MSQDGSNEIEQLTSSVMQCGDENVPPLQIPMKRSDNDNENVTEQHSGKNDNNKRLSITELLVAQNKRSRSIAYTGNDGVAIYRDPLKSIWYTMYMDPLEQNHNYDIGKYFRPQFRMPYNSFQLLILELKMDDSFQMYHEQQNDSPPPPPIELLVCGSLRLLQLKKMKTLYLAGRIEDLMLSVVVPLTNISRELHEHFFDQFVVFGATTLHDKYILNPTTVTSPDLLKCVYNFAHSGLFGIHDNLMKKRIRAIKKRLP